MDAESSGKVILTSSDGEKITVDTKVALMSELVKSSLEGRDDEDTPEVPLPKVTAAALKKIVEYCTHYQSEEMTEIKKPLKSAVMSELVQQWYADFVNVEQEFLFEILLAANFMDIKPLLELTSATVASMCKNKSIEEIRKTFKVEGKTGEDVAASS